MIQAPEPLHLYSANDPDTQAYLRSLLGDDITYQCLPLEKHPHDPAPATLQFGEGRLQLVPTPNSPLAAATPLSVDFTTGRFAHRLRFGGGKRQPVCQAVGLHKRHSLRILDTTAGLAKDAFLMAHVGATVTMLERSPALVALLRDGLHRAANTHPETLQRMTLRYADSRIYCQRLTAEAFDVIYCDPMFEHTTSQAKAKKDMQLLKQLIGPTPDDRALVAAARATAVPRVVVKRHKHAPTLTDDAPTHQQHGKTNRFDIYIHNTPREVIQTPLY